MCENPLGKTVAKIKANSKGYKVPFKKINNTPLEETEQKAFVQWLRYKKIDFFAVPNSNQMSSLNKQVAVRVMAKLKATGLVPGTSDICILLKDKILFIEMKRQKGGTVSKSQKQFLQMLEKYDYAKGYVAYGCKDAIEIVEMEQKHV